MGKTYLKYSLANTFGLVVSPQSNIVSYGDGTYAIVGALENVLVWDVRKGQVVSTLEGDEHAVTCLAMSPDNVHLAVGYSDGTIRVWKVMEGESVITFSAVSYTHLRAHET